MNCKPGDLAVILKPASSNIPDEVTGMFVEVIERAVPGNRLPDGLTLAWSGYDPMCPAWLVRASAAIPNALIDRKTGIVFPSRYIAMWDHRLRPINSGDISDEEVRDLYLPAPTRELA